MTGWNDERVEQIISVLLRTGVILSAAVVLAGGICFLVRHGNESADYRSFHGTPEAYQTISGVIRAIGPSNCRAVIQFGLLLLIATPIVRVSFSLVAFVLERDRVYTVVTLIVLAILLYSLAGPH
jgi:uncharacterized membrane protein